MFSRLSTGLKSSFKSLIGMQTKNIQIQAEKLDNDDLKLLEKADAYLAANKDELAAEFYSEYLAKHPDNPFAWNNYGYCLDSLCRLDSAIIAYNEAIKLKTDCDSAHNNLGWAFHQKGQLEEAFTEYVIALEQDPNNLHAMVNIGLYWFDKGYPDTARDMYNRIIIENPNFDPAYYERARVYRSLNKIDLAVQDLQKAIEIDPDYIAALYLLGVIKIGQYSSYTDAIKLFEQCTNLDPDNSTYHYALGITLWRKNTYTKITDVNISNRIIRTFQRVVELDSFNHQAYTYLREIYNILGDKVKVDMYARLAVENRVW